MVIVISDLLVDEDEMTKAVSVLRAVGHDVTVLHIRDPAERDLAIAKTETELIDTESAASVNVMLSEVRDAYRETVQVAIGEWRDALSPTRGPPPPVAPPQPRPRTRSTPPSGSAGRCPVLPPPASTCRELSRTLRPGAGRRGGRAD